MAESSKCSSDDLDRDFEALHRAERAIADGNATNEDIATWINSPYRGTGGSITETLLHRYAELLSGTTPSESPAHDTEPAPRGAKGLYKFLNSLPTVSTAEVFSNEECFGIAVGYSVTGFGFGEIVFSVDRKTGDVDFDHDGNGLDRCEEIISRLVGTTVSEYDTTAEEVGPANPE